VPLLPLVDLDNLLGVDGDPLVGVHHHAEQAGVGLNSAKIFITESEILKNFYLKNRCVPLVPVRGYTLRRKC
jgi:hypothetical protein